MRFCIVFFLSAAASLAAESVRIDGKVTDASGKPLEHATVMVYEARVRTGYSIFCPSCWPDCGKHAFADREGNFSIAGLNPELVFDLLVVKDGYRDLPEESGPAEGARGDGFAQGARLAIGPDAICARTGGG